MRRALPLAMIVLAGACTDAPAPVENTVIDANDPAEADAMFLRILRLDEAGFVLRISRHFTRREGVVWQGFEALIEPAASTYLATAASERVRLSRDPLPAT